MLLTKIIVIDCNSLEFFKFENSPKLFKKNYYFHVNVSDNNIYYSNSPYYFINKDGHPKRAEVVSALLTDNKLIIDDRLKNN
jgi:hypothetical protein